MQNKPYFFFWKQGFPKGGEGGEGSDTWEIFPKNPVFFWGGVPYFFFRKTRIRLSPDKVHKGQAETFFSGVQNFIEVSAKPVKPIA